VTHTTLERWKYRAAVAAFALPALVLFTVVVTYPIVQTLLKGFYRWDGIGTPVYVGIANFVKLFGNPDFRTALLNGAICVLVLAVYQIGVGTVLALTLLDRRLKLRTAFKAAYFIPVVLSITVVCQLWLRIYNYDHGLLNSLFKALGWSYRQTFLVDRSTSIVAVIFVNAWQFVGIHLVFVYAAAQTIPEHLFEAARLDGAPPWKMHWYITLPLLAETYKFCLTLAVTGGLQIFGQVYIMTNGGPGTSTYTLTLLMYKLAFLTNQFGYASSVAAFLIVECLAATILINRFVARQRYTF
jgi:raffinose/stachyose/melibiose transport system permease protein